MKTIFDRVQKGIADVLGVTPDRVKMSAELVADLGADSLDRVELVQWLELEFGITIPDADFYKEDVWLTVRSLYVYMDRRLAEPTKEPTKESAPKPNIKSVITMPEPPVKRRYPRLARNSVTGMVVLFREKGKGTVVFCDSTQPRLPIHEIGALVHVTEEVFTLFKGTVTLSNEG